MTILWVSLSIAGALFQAVSWAMNYKNLNQIKEVQNGKAIIGFFNYAAATIVITLYAFLTKGLSFEIKDHFEFWKGIAIAMPFNVLGVVIGYRAMQLAEYSFVTPWVTLTTLFTVVTAYVGLEEIPTGGSLVGMVFIVAGALLISFKKKSKKILSESEELQRKNMRLATIYVIIVGIAFSISPIGTKIAVQQSSPMLVVIFTQLILAILFLIMPFALFVSRKSYNVLKNEKEVSRKKINFSDLIASFKKLIFKKNFLKIALLTGIAMAIANGSIYTALQWGSVSYVMALKRLNPLFAFLIAYFIFKERKNVKRKLLATALMVAGAVLIGIFG
jgi:drug/metabolite transporter (DMT)-like permease